MVLWKVTSRKQTAELYRGRGRGPTYDVAFSPDGKRVAAASGDGFVRLWDVATQKRLGHLRAGGPIVDVAFTSDGGTVAAGGFDGVVRLWDVATGQRSGLLNGRDGAVHRIAFSPDGTKAGHRQRPRRASVGRRDRKSIRRLATGAGPAYGIAFRPDGEILAASTGRRIRLWNPETGTQLGRLSGHTSLITSIAFSKDGQTLASASLDTSVRLWNPAATTRPDRLGGHRGQVRAVAYSRDGRLFASAGDDGTILVRRRTTRTVLHRLRRHTAHIRALAFSPRGGVLASADDDGTIRLWNARARRPARAAPPPKGRPSRRLQPRRHDPRDGRRRSPDQALERPRADGARLAAARPQRRGGRRRVLPGSQDARVRR